MIIGNLSNVKSEMAFYPLALQKGLNFLMENDLTTLTLGRHEIEGKNIYANVAEYQTQPQEERRPERHDNYVDIQYIAQGSEKICSGLLKDVGAVDEDCLKERDVVFYQGSAKETEVILMEGMFAIYFPWDVHRPNCNSNNQSHKVRKVVVKIPINTL
jgi:biofilm protein TabA